MSVTYEEDRVQDLAAELDISEVLADLSLWADEPDSPRAEVCASCILDCVPTCCSGASASCGSCIASPPR